MRTLIAGVLMGVVVGALLGWASVPEPNIESRLWWAGSSTALDRITSRHLDMIVVFMASGSVVGAVLGAVAAGGVIAAPRLVKLLASR